MQAATLYSGNRLVPMSHEQPSHHPDSGGPEHPTVLPPELVEFLKARDYACIPQATDLGTAFVMKVPGSDIQSVRGVVPVELRQELYAHPAAPVIRMVFTIYDQPAQPLALETFINITDEEQRADYAALATQEALPLLFFDEAVTHRLTKVVPFRNQEESAAILGTAERFLGTIPVGERDFDTARATVLRVTQL
jgi:hypothetical protein